MLQGCRRGQGPGGGGGGECRSGGAQDGGRAGKYDEGLIQAERRVGACGGGGGMCDEIASSVLLPGRPHTTSTHNTHTNPHAHSITSKPPGLVQQDEGAVHGGGRGG